jgi:predicted RNA-binding Zn-ribbon protein involved in translation (DUF1610 family)
LTLTTELSRPAAEDHRKPTVRIVKRRMPTPTALASLLIAAAAAAMAFGAWRVWREDSGPPVYRRTIADLVLTYECLRGHRFNAQGQVEPLKCMSCGTPAFPVTTYVCPAHGEIEVMVRFELDAKGEAEVAAISRDGERWLTVELGLQCPRCGQPMFRESESTIADLGKKPDGEATRRPPTPTKEQPRPSFSPENDFPQP